MFGLEMNNLLKTCINEYLTKNPIIEIIGNYEQLPEFLANKKIKQVKQFSNDSLKIRAEDWAILPFETKTKKYIIGWIEKDNVIENNVLIGIAVWFKIPQLSFVDNENVYPDYISCEEKQLDPMINIEGGFYG